MVLYKSKERRDMTKKDYIAIADAIAYADTRGKNYITELVGVFKRDNPKFDADVFFEYLNKKVREEEVKMRKEEEEF